MSLVGFRDKEKRSSLSTFFVLFILTYVTIVIDYQCYWRIKQTIMSRKPGVFCIKAVILLSHLTSFKMGEIWFVSVLGTISILIFIALSRKGDNFPVSWSTIQGRQFYCLKGRFLFGGWVFVVLGVWVFFVCLLYNPGAGHMRQFDKTSTVCCWLSLHHTNTKELTFLNEKENQFLFWSLENPVVAGYLVSLISFYYVIVLSQIQYHHPRSLKKVSSNLL